MKDSYVLDACALIAMINNEPGADKVEAILRKALLGNVEGKRSILGRLSYS